MFKATATLQKMLRRLPLSTKQASKEYYKGNKVGKLGTISRYGNFSPDWSAIRTYVYPQFGTKNSEVRTECFTLNTLAARRWRCIIIRQYLRCNG
jgi:large subunit ribosomal protein L41